jgi:hypothetical protein
MAAGVEYFHRKYGAATGTEAERTEAIRNELVALRNGLAGGDVLLGTFTLRRCRDGGGACSSCSPSRGSGRP